MIDNHHHHPTTTTTNMTHLKSPLLLIYLLYILFGLLANSCTALSPNPIHPDDNQVNGARTPNGPNNYLAPQQQQQPLNLNLANRVAAGYLFAENTDQRLNLDDPIDAKLSSILDRRGPDMRSSRDFHDFRDVTVDVSKRAWELLHEHASKAIKDRIELARPTIEQLLIEAQVSEGCYNSTGATFDGAIRMESWAIKLINSWGNFPPIGVFEGTYGEMGSYHTCVKIPHNQPIDHAHYCSIAFRPIIPSRNNYEIVVRKEPDELIKMFENLKHDRASSSKAPNNVRDAFTDILDHAQYHHFVAYKWGTCWPIHCTPFDIKRVAKLIGRRNILTAGPVKCYSLNRNDYEYPKPATNNSDSSNTTTQLADNDNDNDDNRKLKISTWDLNDGIFIWKPYFFTTHKVALAIVACLTVFILFMTGVDIIVNKLPPTIAYVRFALSDLPVVVENGQSRQQPAASALMELREGGQPICKEPSLASESGPSNIHPPAPIEVPADVSSSLPEQEVIYKRPTCDGGCGVPIKSRELTGFMGYVDDCSILTSCSEFFAISQGQLKNDILCLNGLRCLTMVWIIMTHTMAYCDWSAFARTREIEKSLKSPIGQPFFNGSYLVDTFFLMSGLLSAYTAFKQCKGLAEKFKSIPFILGRWLRLTPQIFFVNLLFILVPAVSHGPHWYSLVGEYSENCVNNWWINLIHIQAFYKTEDMCNFVTWWVSVDFFFHYCAILIIWAILYCSHRFGFLTLSGLVASQVAYEMFRHYQKSMPPNVFSTIPHSGALWTDMTLGFFWKPYTHAVPFFFGFYVGYLMAMKQKLIVRFLTPRRVLLGWMVAIPAQLSASYGTYWWVTGAADYSRTIATLAYATFPIIWSGFYLWIIVACHYGFGGFLNRFLTMRIFLILGKASYMVYLSHFQIVFPFLGSSNLLLEPTEPMMLYVVLGNIFVSALYGMLLCIVYEQPWLKFHRRIMRKYF